MNRYLNAAAASDYLGLVQASFALDVVDRSMLLERLSVLARIAQPSSAEATYAQSALRLGDWPTFDDDWGTGIDELAGEEAAGGRLFDLDEDVYVYFATDAGGLGKWYFRPGDPDFFPSVPHGHYENRKSPKLDPYLGWTYVGAKQTGRIARRNVVALWNDQGFRNVAADAIRYYLSNHSHYRGWRVANPKRLPRRRKA